MSDKVSDEMLMAFVDGELEAQAFEEVARAVAADPALAQRADAFRTSRDAAREAFGPVMAEPVPGRLVDAILQRNPGDHAASRRRGLMRSALPLAASVALAAGLGGYLLGRAAAPDASPLLGGPALADAVGTTPAGEQRTVRIAGRDVAVTALADYAVDGGLCRTFEAVPAASDAARGIGCRFGETWHIDIAVALPDGNGFTPASSASVASLDAYLDALSAEGPLGLDEETRRR
jgi:anti-sigma factor RsiW